MPEAKKSSYFDRQNAFFYEQYRKLKKLALFPYQGWHVSEEAIQSDDPIISFNAAMKDIKMKRYLTPILAPATVVCVAAAIVLGVGLLICHAISSVVSAIIDSPAHIGTGCVPMWPVIPVNLGG